MGREFLLSQMAEAWSHADGLQGLQPGRVDLAKDILGDEPVATERVEEFGHAEPVVVAQLMTGDGVPDAIGEAEEVDAGDPRVARARGTAGPQDEGPDGLRR